MANFSSCQPESKVDGGDMPTTNAVRFGTYKTGTYAGTRGEIIALEYGKD